MFLCPSPHLIKVLARVLGVEVWKGVRVVLVIPHLPYHPRVDVAHEHLADGVDAMRCRPLVFRRYLPFQTVKGVVTY